MGPFGTEFETAPKPPEKPAPPPPPPPPPPHEFPLGWITERACAPIKYRSFVDVAKVVPIPPLFPSLVYGYRPALALMQRQRPDGSWSTTLDTPGGGVPGSTTEYDGVGTVSACHRLLEFGWERESPPLASARRLLFRLLAEDNDRGLTFEYAVEGSDPEVQASRRAISRASAAAVLAHAGYETDPRLRGAANRLLERVRTYLRSPLAEDPWVRVGGKQVLATDAAPPTVQDLVMLAHMPQYRYEHHDLVDLFAAYFVRPVPRPEAVQLVGARPVAHPTLLLGDPLGGKGVPDADLPFALWWLELVARLGLLRRHEGWSRVFDQLLDGRDSDYIWRPNRASVFRSEQAAVWPYAPLESPSTPEAVSIEVTFRLGMIARYAGRPIELT